MGSERKTEATTTIHVTGFSKFEGVPENPTETIVHNLKEYLERNGYPETLVLGSCSILKTAGKGELGPLYQILQSSISSTEEGDDQASDGRVLWIHFGVDTGATRFMLEHRAFNEASFRWPDEHGWQPQKEPIIPDDGSILHFRETTLPIKKIATTLSEKGFDVITSEDAGRFVCNYVYYHSLRFAEEHDRVESLFVHVPLFSIIAEDTQMQFVASLLGELASLT